MKVKTFAKVLICLICTAFMAGCANKTDSALKDKLEVVKEKTEEETREEDGDEVESKESDESEETKDDKAEEESLAQRMAGKYSYHASDGDEEEYYIMDVVPFGDNLYAFCGQAFSDDDESLEAYSFWATEFIPYDAKEMSSSDGNTVKVNELNFSVMSNAGKYWDAGHTGTITLTDEGLVFEGFDQDGFLVPDDDDSRLFLKDERVEDAFVYLKDDNEAGDESLKGYWVSNGKDADFYILFLDSNMYIYRKSPDKEVFYAAGGCDYHDGSFDFGGNRIDAGGMPLDIMADYKTDGDTLILDIQYTDATDELPDGEEFHRITKDDVHVTTMDEIVFDEDSFGAFGQMEEDPDSDLYR